MASLEIVPSAARTTTGASGAIYTLGREKMAVMLDVTAVSGTTPNMALAIEWSHDGSTWFPSETADTMTAVTAAGKKTKDYATKGDYMRLAWTITGTTPSFTFSARMWIEH